jgi:quercetin dioxygenase-like cupin family protein
MGFKRSIAIGMIPLVILVGTAVAQEVTGGFLARGTLGKVDAHNDGIQLETNRRADVVVARFTFEPGSSSGWHHDRGVVLAVVQSGRLQEIDEGCDRRVIKAGETFFEEGDTHLIRNTSNRDAVIRVTFIVPSGTPTDEIIIPDDAPEACDIA